VHSAHPPPPPPPPPPHPSPFLLLNVASRAKWLRTVERGAQCVSVSVYVGLSVRIPYTARSHTVYLTDVKYVHTYSYISISRKV
jgi:hypothetical protein